MVQQSTGVAVELLVDMSCAGCVKPVHEALRSIPGTQPAPPRNIAHVLPIPIASLGARRVIRPPSFTSQDWQSGVAEAVSVVSSQWLWCGAT